MTRIEVDGFERGTRSGQHGGSDRLEPGGDNIGSVAAFFFLPFSYRS